MANIVVGTSYWFSVGNATDMQPGVSHAWTWTLANINEAITITAHPLASFNTGYITVDAIHGLIAVNAPADRIPMLAPGPGLFVAEVEGEVPGLKPEPDESDLEALRKIVQTLRVATPIPRCKLVSKP